ncbi:MAG: sensor histidine kinase, partial [Chloroflexota bacterium]
MRSLRLKVLVAFVAVALLTVAVAGFLVDRAVTAAFSRYLAGRESTGLGGMANAMDGMMGPGSSQAMIRRMFGAPEQAYLASIHNSLWLAGAFAVAVAIVASLALSGQITAPARALTRAARSMAAGKRDQRVAVGARDELGEVASAFNALSASLAEQETLRRQMAADVAHELRTPLAVLQAKIEALQDGIRPVSEAALGELHQEVRLLSRLVADLRDLSLAEAGQLPLKREPADVGALARASVERFMPAASEKGVRLLMHTGPGLPPVDVDQERFAQVLGNLLENALRHTSPAGQVETRVALASVGNGVEIAVYDSGPGIPGEHLAHIFERFYRIDPARSRAEGGSGIGLAVVKQLIEAHGGKVWAESPTGQGASFHMVLPPSSVPAVAETPAPVP